MKISTKGRYALRLMLDLAMNDEGNVIRIKDIAARQNISDKYLEQIISILNKATLLPALTAILTAIFKAKAVLPIAGRAAIIISSFS